MAIKLENKFEIWQLEEGEYEQAVTFSTAQRQLLQSYIGQTAHRLLGLNFLEMSIDEYKLQHAYLTGKIEILEELLSLQDSLALTDESAPTVVPPQLDKE